VTPGWWIELCVEVAGGVAAGLLVDQHVSRTLWGPPQFQWVAVEVSYALAAEVVTGVGAGREQPSDPVRKPPFTPAISLLLRMVRSLENFISIIVAIPYENVEPLWLRHVRTMERARHGRGGNCHMPNFSETSTARRDQ
jgi:hypothetical protein